MGTILSFPQERREPAEDFSFVNDGEMLDFDGDEADIRLDRAAAEQDWANQELADLYRVKHLLDQAGIASETDRGITDEGDPWFVFMRADGEVFIHFCRIDGTYYLDSPNLDTALKGQDARALVAAYTRKVMARADSGHDSKTVVSLGAGGGRVSLHPAVMLAALVWSLLTGAEDALSLPALETSDTPESMNPEMPRLGQIGAVRETAQNTVTAEDGTATATPQAETLHSRDALSGFNGYATGLTAIAIGIGVLADRGLDLLDDTSLEQIFQSLSGLGTGTDRSAGETDRSALSSAAEIDALDILVKITQMPVGSDMLMEAGAAAPDGPHGAEGLMASTIGQVLTAPTDSAELPAQIAPALENMLAFDAADNGRRKTSDSHVSDASETPAAAPQASSTTPSQTPSAQSTQSVSAAPSYAPGLTLSEFMVGESVLFASFKVTETLLDKFDVTDLLSVGAADTLSEPYLEEEDLGAGLMFDISRVIDEMEDGDARDMIQIFLARQTDLDVADSGTWIWIVEADAQYAPLDQTISKVFDTDDGSRIMITGLQTTFADADIGIG